MDHFDSRAEVSKKTVGKSQEIMAGAGTEDALKAIWSLTGC
jgi:hypothetical protein